MGRQSVSTYAPILAISLNLDILKLNLKHEEKRIVITSSQLRLLGLLQY